MGSIYLVRHGQTTCNADGIIQGPRVDSDLSGEGRNQAVALAQAFQGIPLDSLYCSPLLRARLTADALVASRSDGLVARVIPELYEMDYGSFCGQQVHDVQEQITKILGAWADGQISEAFPGGESPVMTQHRLRRFAERMRLEAEQSNIVVVAHGRVNRILSATLLDVPLSEQDRFPQDNANITQLDVNDGQVELIRVNDTDHLGPVPAR